MSISLELKFLQLKFWPSLLLYPGQVRLAGGTEYRGKRIAMISSILQACVNANEDAKGSKENGYAIGQNKVLSIVCKGILRETNLYFGLDCADIPKCEERSD